MKDSPRGRHDARRIWQAGIDAVRADRLVHTALRCEGDLLCLGDQRQDLSQINRIVVVGAGKGGASMAAAIEDRLGPERVAEKVSGWVNVPDNCVRQLQKIHLHAARPAGLNEPTAAGVAGSEKILEMLGQLTKDDLCLVLISGGGSALLPAPQPPIGLADLLAVTRLLMQAGATINELNAVRKCLSRIKGGQLAQASRAGILWGLIVSDVVGDPLDVIASGPTVPDHTSRSQAKKILQRFSRTPGDVPETVFHYLDQVAENVEPKTPFPNNVYNTIIGNNQTALSAATAEAKQLGYQIVSLGSANQREAGAEGRDLAEHCLNIREAGDARTCLLSGGEPVVQLPEEPGKGGRNQHLVLAGVDRLWEDGMQKITLLSGGSDGEDGPTDAAGAWADAGLLKAARKQGLEPHNAYVFFDRLEGLVRTGPTHTNVMDLRVGIVAD